MARAGRILLILLLLYASWLGMMLLHELGHLAHAFASGAVIERVDIPLWGFSQTHLRTNPRPLIVAWGGTIWGSLLPLAVWLLMQRLALRGHRLAQFFAGFCLIANGLYLGLGWTLDAGDAADLRRLGAPEWVMACIGLIAFAGGLILWHRMGPRPGFRAAKGTTKSHSA